MKHEGTLRVLIVDDESLMLEFVANIVRRAGGEVTALASNGNEAWTLIEQDNRFDRIITDVSMPGGDGIPLVQKIYQAFSPANRAPIYIHSASQHYCLNSGPLFLPEQIPVMFPGVVFFPKDRNTRRNIHEFISLAIK